MKKSSLSTPTHNQKIIGNINNYVGYTPTTSHIFTNQRRSNGINQKDSVLQSSIFYQERLRGTSTNSYQVGNGQNQNYYGTRLISLDALQDRFSQKNNSLSNQTVAKGPNLPLKQTSMSPIVFKSKVTNLTSQVSYNPYLLSNHNTEGLKFQLVNFSKSARVLPTSKLIIKTAEDEIKQQCQTPTLNQAPTIKKLFSFNDDDFIVGSQQLICTNKLSKDSQQKNTKKTKKLKRMQSSGQNSINRDQILYASPTYISKKGKHQFKSPKSLKRYLKDGHLKVTKIYTQQSQKQEQSQNQCQGQQTQKNDDHQLLFDLKGKCFQKFDNLQNLQKQRDSNVFIEEGYLNQGKKLNGKNFRLSFTECLECVFDQLKVAEKKLQNLQKELHENQRLRRKDQFQNQLKMKNQKLKELKQEKEYLQHLQHLYGLTQDRTYSQSQRMKQNKGKNNQYKLQEVNYAQFLKNNFSPHLTLNFKLQSKLMIGILLLLLLVLFK